MAADGKRLVMITGANQGGKSTFLRSLGLAQLMMQAGMFVAAESFTASVSTGIFTHFKREEDATMERGKLDEELGRMSEIAGQIRPGCLLLCNESFASTNEREGSEIARQVIRALTEAGIRVVFVTHLYDLAQRCFAAATTRRRCSSARSGSPTATAPSGSLRRAAADQLRPGPLPQVFGGRDQVAPCPPVLTRTARATGRPCGERRRGSQ